MISIIHTELLQSTDSIFWYLNPVLIYIYSGTVHIEINHVTRFLHTGDILYCNPFTLFNISSIHGEIFVLHLNLNKFSSLTQINTNLQISCDSNNDANNDKYHQLEKLIKNYIFCTQENDFKNYCAQISLITFLLTEFVMPTALLENTVSDINHSDIELLHFSLKYIQEHFQENIQIKDIAETCHITETYLARIYKKYLPSTPSEFLNETRLLAAKKLLLNTNLPLKSISEAVGFSSPRSFNIFFERKFQTLPAQFRLQEKRKITPYTSTIHDAVHESSIKELSVNTKSISIDLTQSPVTKIGNTYRLMYVGKLSHLGHEQFYKRFIEYQQRFNFKYALISGLTDDDVLRGIHTPDKIVWDYSMIDKYIMKILDAGLIPLISISGIPSILSEGFTQFYVSHTSIPDNLSSITAFYEDFFSHLKIRFGKILDNWKCAIWHIPEDISEQTQINRIYDFYAAIYKIIRKICPSMCIGSPEQRISESAFSEIASFKEYCIKNQCIPDFFIIHTSGEFIKEKFYSDSTINIHCEADTYKALTYIKKYKLQLQKYFENKEFICSNFELFAFQNPLNDTLFAAAGLSAFLSNALTVFDMISISLLPVQLYDTAKKEEFNNSPCLITKSGIFKACAYAYTFLMQLNGDIILLDKHVCFSKGNLSFQLLLQNPISIQYRTKKTISTQPIVNYAVKSQKKYLSLNTDTEFWPQQPLHSNTLLQIQINHISDGTYILNEYHINAEHGSVFDYWLKEGSPNNLTDDDIKYLSSISVPLRSKKTIYIKNKTLFIERNLEANEVCLITLTPTSL